MLKINEIFYSVQGEAANTGMPAVFIRFAGCNLKCSYCDTDHRCNQEMSANQIMDCINEYGCYNVVITGGEPALQKEALEELLKVLALNQCYVCVETNGTIAFDCSHVQWLTVSPKGTREDLAYDICDELKVVYQGGEDVAHWHEEVMAQHYYLQPCDQNGKMNIMQTIDQVKEDPRWRLSLQTQKLVGVK